MNIINRPDLTTPIIFSTCYSDSLKQIIYRASEEGLYNSFSTRVTTIVDFTNHRKSRLEFERFHNEELNFSSIPDDFYAYGVMINALRSNVIGLDFDGITWSDLRHLLGAFIDEYHTHINQIDVVSSSTAANFHIYIGLNSYFKVHEVVNTFPRVCRGFKYFCVHNYESVLRVSEKFYKYKAISIPTIAYILKKKDDNVFIASRNIGYPISTLETKIVEPKEKKISLNLRK